eukprot:6381429-Amphidinium_carterae.2
MLNAPRRPPLGWCGSAVTFFPIQSQVSFIVVVHSSTSLLVSSLPSLHLYMCESTSNNNPLKLQRKIPNLQSGRNKGNGVQTSHGKMAIPWGFCTPTS